MTLAILQDRKTALRVLRRFPIKEEISWVGSPSLVKDEALYVTVRLFGRCILIGLSCCREDGLLIVSVSTSSSRLGRQRAQAVVGA